MDECKPLMHGGTGATALMAAAGKGRHMEVSQLLGRGLHLFTLELNLSNPRTYS